jgi:hypothetical protein
MRSARRLWSCLALVAVSVVTVGCRGDQLATYPVSGSVDITGVGDLKSGEVIFTNETITAKGQIQPDGTFKLTTYKENDGAPAGKYQAFILGAAKSKATASDPYAIEYLIDPSFTDRKTSGLEFTVEEGPNEFTIAVTPPGQKEKKAAPQIRTKT